MSIIEKLLNEEPYLTELKDYQYINNKNLDKIPLGMHIKFIDNNGKIKSGGFLIKYVQNKDIRKSYYILKSNIIYKLYIYNYWILYKKHKKTLNKRQIFIKLLNSI